MKPLSCFDVSCDGRFLVAGTEVFKDDAFLLFWDIRTTNLLGGYWDTHQEDITQVNILWMYVYALHSNFLKDGTNSQLSRVVFIRDQTSF